MRATADRSQEIRIPADVLMRELGDEAVLLHLATETYFGLDELAEHGLVEIDAP